MTDDNHRGGGFDEQPLPRNVSLDYKVVTKVNFASAQNDVAIIERFAIDNPTDESLVDVRVTLRAAPPIVREKIWSVDRIAQGSELSLRDLSTPLDIERLAGLDEAEIGELEFRVEAQGVDTIVESLTVLDGERRPPKLRPSRHSRLGHLADPAQGGGTVSQCLCGVA